METEETKKLLRYCPLMGLNKCVRDWDKKDHEIRVCAFSREGDDMCDIEMLVGKIIRATDLLIHKEERVRSNKMNSVRMIEELDKKIQMLELCVIPTDQWDKGMYEFALNLAREEAAEAQQKANPSSINQEVA